MVSSQGGAIFDRIAHRFPSRRVILGARTKDPNKVDNTSAAYDDMWVDWELIEDLCEGRDQMVLKAQRWLPQERGEEQFSYNVRLDRSFLFGGLSDTLQRLAAKPFSKEVTIQNEEELPEDLTGFHRNVDLRGTSLTTFAKRMFQLGMKYGHSLVLVDHPRVEEGITLAEEQRRGLRPYWKLISPPNLIGWRSFISDGKETLTQIRFRDERIEAEGQYGDKKVDHVVVWNAPPAVSVIGPDEFLEQREGLLAAFETEEERASLFGTVEVHRRKDDGSDEFDLIETTRHSYPGIPLVWLPLNPTGEGLLRSRPPFLELAEANLEHWQKSSDLSNILRFVSVAMVLLTGDFGTDADDESTGGPDDVVWAVNQILHGSDGADGKYIEHSGQGIGALQAYVDKLEERMEMLGMQPLLAKQQDITATAQQKDDKKTTSGLQSWIRILETTIHWLYAVSATWRRIDPMTFLDPQDEDSVSFDVFSDFGVRVSTRDDAGAILEARKNGEISRETFLSEWQKRGMIGEEVDITEEAERLENEAMANAEMFGLPGEEDEEDPEDGETEDDGPPAVGG